MPVLGETEHGGIATRGQKHKLGFRHKGFVRHVRWGKARKSKDYKQAREEACKTAKTDFLMERHPTLRIVHETSRKRNITE